MADIIHAFEFFPCCTLSEYRSGGYGAVPKSIWHSSIARRPQRWISPFLFFLLLTKTPRFHLFTFSPFHLFTISILTKTPRFHDFTFSRFHDFTSSISRYDAVALYLAPDGNHLTAVAVAAWAAGLFSLLPWNLDNLARCVLQTLTLQCPVIGIGVGAGGYIDRITPSHCRRGREDK